MPRELAALFESHAHLVPRDRIKPAESPRSAGQRRGYLCEMMFWWSPFKGVVLTDARPSSLSERHHLQARCDQLAR